MGEAAVFGRVADRVDAHRQEHEGWPGCGPITLTRRGAATSPA
jgi:hypothetical protein